ncbi:hypothetical protein FTUN_0415 [Frigoriglobus tundricola]|uniref:Alginate export domain-containing protein n=1 Tax=Frigoriglobus tundricola TaxID=2774151 RepID=A0A6M5YG14_9BACT|nr:hypothetical protein FTUN_0415 [Frigoriglobus tundricola]
MPVEENARPLNWSRFVLAGMMVLAVESIGHGYPPTPVPVEIPQVSLEPVPSDGSKAPPNENRVTPPPGEGTPSSPSGSARQREFSGPTQKPDSEKSFWEKVPPVQPFPRAGNFFNAPSGQGFYTLFDFVRDRELSNRPKNPYLQWGQNANPSFNLDFRFLDDPDNTQFDLFDPLKRVHVGDNWLFSTGGEVRDRYATIQNPTLYNKKPQAGADDTFNLFRTRVYGDLWYRDQFRFFVEFITADSSHQAIPAASTDVEQNDFLNLFVELKLLTLDDHGVYARIGRQELLFGSQRLVSPSDWSNTRRTFQGVRASWHNDTIEEDAFVVNPVVPDPGRISSIDDKQVFAGNWFKYRFNKDSSIDLYYLYLDNTNPGVAKGRYGATGAYDVNTVGSRLVGEQNQFLWDFEGAVQFGGWANQSIFAGFGVAGLGYYFKDVPTTPTLWAYYDYASGDPNPNKTNVHRTFGTLFPFGHSYFAGLDAIGRQNINDLHLEYAMFPAKWVRATLGYHVLSLDSAKDALYNTSGGVVRQDPTGRAGKDVGEAISTTVQFHLDNHQIFFVGYSHLFGGRFIKQTAVTPGAAKDLDALWVQYTFKW